MINKNIKSAFRLLLLTQAVVSASDNMQNNTDNAAPESAGLSESQPIDQRRLNEVRVLFEETADQYKNLIDIPGFVDGIIMGTPTLSVENTDDQSLLLALDAFKQYYKICNPWSISSSSTVLFIPFVAAAEAIAKKYGSESTEVERVVFNNVDRLPYIYLKQQWPKTDCQFKEQENTGSALYFGTLEKQGHVGKIGGSLKGVSQFSYLSQIAIQDRWEEFKAQKDIVEKAFFSFPPGHTLEEYRFTFIQASIAAADAVGKELGFQSAVACAVIKKQCGALPDWYLQKTWPAVWEVVRESRFSTESTPLDPKILHEARTLFHATIARHERPRDASGALQRIQESQDLKKEARSNPKDPEIQGRLEEITEQRNRDEKHRYYFAGCTGLTLVQYKEGFTKSPAIAAADAVLKNFGISAAYVVVKEESFELPDWYLEQKFPALWKELTTPQVRTDA